MKNVIFLLTLLLATACSVDSNDSNIVPPTKHKFMDQRKSIAGPNLDGTWISKCNSKRFGEGYRSFTLTINGENVERSEFVYIDSDCKELVERHISKGIFRFVESYSDDTFEIEYAFSYDSGITTYPLEKIKREENLLFISDFVVGELGKVLEEEALYLDGQFSEVEEPDDEVDPPGSVPLLEDGEYYPTTNPDFYNQNIQVTIENGEIKFVYVSVVGSSYTVDMTCAQNFCQGTSSSGERAELKILAKNHYDFFSFGSSSGSEFKKAIPQQKEGVAKTKDLAKSTHQR